jgi:hypothetical protein
MEDELLGCSRWEWHAKQSSENDSADAFESYVAVET